jgi:hypothetical protein
MYNLNSSGANHKVNTIKEDKIKKLWEGLIGSFDFTTNWGFVLEQTVCKTPRLTVLLLLRVYSLPRERVYRDVV